jgi:hypothetical protein
MANCKKTAHWLENPQALKVHEAAREAYQSWENLFGEREIAYEQRNLLCYWAKTLPLHVFFPEGNIEPTIIAGFHIVSFAKADCAVIKYSSITNIEIERIAWADFLTVCLIASEGKFDWEHLRNIVVSSMPDHVKEHFFGTTKVSRPMFAGFLDLSVRELKALAEKRAKKQKLGGSK